MRRPGIAPALVRLAKGVAVAVTVTGMDIGPALSQIYVPPPPPPIFVPPFPQYGAPPPMYVPMPQQFSNRCATNFGVCMLRGAGPMGQPCYCNTPQGPVPGQIIP